jgi:hypothetical protein
MKDDVDPATMFKEFQAGHSFRNMNVRVVFDQVFPEYFLIPGDPTNFFTKSMIHHESISIKNTLQKAIQAIWEVTFLRP